MKDKFSKIKLNGEFENEFFTAYCELQLLGSCHYFFITVHYDTDHIECALQNKSYAKDREFVPSIAFKILQMAQIVNHLNKDHYVEFDTLNRVIEEWGQESTKLIADHYQI